MKEQNPYARTYTNDERDRIFRAAVKRHDASKRARGYRPALGRYHCQAIAAELWIGELIGQPVPLEHAGDGRPDFYLDNGTRKTALEVVSRRVGRPEYLVSQKHQKRAAKHAEQDIGTEVVFTTVSGAPLLDDDGHIIEEDEMMVLFEMDVPLVVTTDGWLAWKDVEAVELSSTGMDSVRKISPQILNTNPPIRWGHLAGM